MRRIFKLTFIFIPYHHIGGAGQVHLNILKALKSKPIVFFDYANTNHISEDFLKNAYCFLITTTKRKKVVVLLLQFLSYIFPIVLFGCNSRFFYTILPMIKNRVDSIDLTHAFSYPDKGIEIISLDYVQWIRKRVVINNKTFEDYKKLYVENNIDLSFLERFEIIENGIEIEDFDSSIIETRFNNFTIGFVGRNSKEKRPQLFFKIVKNANLKAKVIGDNFEEFKEEFKEVIFFENCNNPKMIRREFSEISVLIVTSSREGFPLVIMEAMELGIPVISTNVGSISDHVTNNMNGFLANNNDETRFLDFAVETLNNLVRNKGNYSTIAINARKYALEYFNKEVFEKKYRKLFYK